MSACGNLGSWGQRASPALLIAVMQASALASQGLLADSLTVPYTVVLPTSMAGPPTAWQTGPLTFTVASNASAADASLLLLFLLPGFNILPEYYSRCVGRVQALTSEAALAASSTSWQLSGARSTPGACCGAASWCCASRGRASQSPPPRSTRLWQSQSPACPVSCLGALAALPAMREANPLELVLLGHSAGGAVALDVAGGCQQPWANAVYCAGYQSLNETALVGIAAWEGYLPMPVALDPGTFVPYFEGSESGAGTMVGMAAALRSTSTAGGNLTFASPAGAAADDPGCVGLVTVGGAGHFGITDYTPSTNASEGQVRAPVAPSACRIAVHHTACSALRRERSSPLHVLPPALLRMLPLRWRTGGAVCQGAIPAVHRPDPGGPQCSPGPGRSHDRRWHQGRRTADARCPAAAGGAAESAWSGGQAGGRVHGGRWQLTAAESEAHGDGVSMN